MNKAVALIIIIAVAAIVLNLGGAGTFLSTSVLSVSSTTINGVDKIIVLMTAGGQGDGIVAELTRAAYPAFNTDQTVVLQAYKEGGTYAYTAIDRPGASGTITKYTLLTSCDGWWACGVSTFGGFRDQCKANGVNNIYYNGGSLENPKLRCYKYTPEFKVSDFDLVSGIYDPKIKVYVDEWTGASGSSTLLAQYSTTLTKQTTFQTLSYGGQTIGTVSLEGQLGTFLTPPDASGIKAVRYYSDLSHYYLIPASSLANAEIARDTFTNCVAQASSYNAVALPPLPGFPFGFTFAEFMNDQDMQGCISQYNSAISTLPYIFPYGTFGNLDTSKMDSEKKALLTDVYTIPTLKFELNSESVGISRPIATPVSADCIDKTLPGSQSIGEFTATVTNGGTTGLIYVEASCPAPYDVRTPGGTYFFQPYETKQISIELGLSPQNQSKTCTITAKSGDLATSVSGTCNIKQQGDCSNVPRDGFYLDQWCNEYCPLTASDCPAPGVLKTPATGYPNLCLCDSSTVPPTCDNDGVCEAGESIGNCPADCGQLPPGGTCLPYVQKQNTEVVGGINLFGFVIGGTTVQTCVWDFTVLGIALIGLALVLYKLRRVQEGKALGLAGVLLIVFSFVADNALLLALGGTGIFLIALVAAVAYIIIRLRVI